MKAKEQTKNLIIEISNRYASKGKTKEAIKFLFNYLLNNPDDDELLNLFAAYLYQEEQYDYAALFIEKAFQLSNKNNVVKNNFNIIMTAAEKLKNCKSKFARKNINFSYLDSLVEKINKCHVTIAVCMIVKNEEKNIGRSLESIKNIASEIIVVDTGSEDRTCEIAKEYGAEIRKFQWNSDFSAARNESIRDLKSDWIFFLDADECLDSQSSSFFRGLSSEGKTKAYYVRIISRLSDVDENIVAEHYMVRIFKNKSGFIFNDLIHEQVILENRKDYKKELSFVVLIHYGYLGSAITEKNKNERNYNILTKAIKNSPENPFNYYNIGLQLFSMKDYRESIGYFDKTIEKLNGRQVSYLPFCYSFKSSCFCSLGRYNEAVDQAKEAVNINPNFKEAFFNLANAYYFLNDFENAIKNYETALRVKDEIILGGTIDKGVGTWKSYNGLGITYLKMGDYENAVKYLEKAYGIENKSHTVVLNLVIAYKMLSRIDKIENILSNLEEVLFNVGQAQQMVNILMLFNSSSCAVNFLKKVCLYYEQREIIEDENGLKINLLNENIAELFFAREDYANSLLYYEKYFKNNNNLNESNKWGLKKFAACCFNTGYLEKAEELIDKALDFDSRQEPNDWEIYHHAGIIKMKLSKIDESIQYFIKSISLNEKDTESYLNLAGIYIKIGELAKANEVLESEPGIQNGNLSKEILSLNSEVLFNMGDFSKAAEELYALLFLNENDKAHYRLGLCFIKLKNFKEAAYHFSKAIDCSNQDPSYFTCLGDCFMEMGNYEDANISYNGALLLRSQISSLNCR